MSEGMKRRGLPGMASSGRRRRVHDGITQASVVRGIRGITAAIIVWRRCHRELVADTMSQRRLDWDGHVQDLEERGCLKRMYSMPKETFEKLAACWLRLSGSASTTRVRAACASLSQRQGGSWYAPKSSQGFHKLSDEF